MNRYDSRKEIEVVVHDVRVDGLRRHVNEPGPGLSQQEKQEEEALFVGLLARTLNRALEAYRRHDDDGLRILADVVDRAPERDELLLERLESSICSGWRGHEGGSYPATRPVTSWGFAFERFSYGSGTVAYNFFCALHPEPVSKKIRSRCVVVSNWFEELSNPR